MAIVSCIKNLLFLLKGRLKSIYIILIIMALGFICDTYANSDCSSVLKNKEKTSKEKVDKLIDCGWDRLNKDVIKAKQCGQRALEDSNLLDYNKGKCAVYQLLGACYYNKGSLDSALLMYDIALEHRIAYGDSIMIYGTYNNLGKVYEKQGKYTLALEHYGNAYNFVTDSQRKARLKSNISTLYKLMGDYDEALAYLNEACIILRKSKNPTHFARCQMNKANIHDLMGDYDKALSLYLESAYTFKTEKDELNLAKVTLNIGEIQRKIGNKEEAIKSYNNALRKYEGLSNLAGIAGAKQNLGIVHKAMGDFPVARNYFTDAVEKWTKVGSKPKQAACWINLGNLSLNELEYDKAKTAFLKADALLPDSSVLKSELYYGLSFALANLGQYEEAFFFQRKREAVKKKVALEITQSRNLEARYQEQKNRFVILEKEKKLAIETNKKEKYFRYALFLGFALLAVLFTWLYHDFENKKKQLLLEKEWIAKEQQVEKLLKDQELLSIRNMLDVQEKERKRIAQDLHDRLGSMLSMVKLHFQKTNESIEQLKQQGREDYIKANKLLDQACDEVRKISHNLVSGVLKNFGLVAALEELKTTIINTGKYDVEFIASQLDDRLSSKHEIAIYRIVQELTSNIMRHAEANEISIQLLRKKSSIHISVEDNGKGFNTKNKANQKGIGLKNIESRLYPLNGSLNIDSVSGRGTSVFIEIPLNTKI